MAVMFTEAHSQQLGRHLVAAQHVDTAQVVLQQRPYAAVLYDDQVPLRCDWCFATAAQRPGGTITTTTTLSRCAASKFAHYCSRQHQKAAWRAYYKQECAALLACAPHVPPPTVRLAARVLWRRASEQQQQQQHNNREETPAAQQSASERLQQQLDGGTFIDVEALLSHWQDLDDARKLQYAQMAALTREFMQHALDPQATPAAAAAAAEACMDVKTIALLLARFACNNHTVCDDELRPIGVGIYPLAALVNHACRPNCVQTFSGPNIVFRSLQSVPVGEQLTISYVELAATRQERRRQLLEQYFFDIDQSAAQRTQGQPQQQQETAAAAAATGAAHHTAASSMQESGLQRLLLLVQLPQVQHIESKQQPDQQLPLWTSTQDEQQQQSSPASSTATATTTAITPANGVGPSHSSSRHRAPWPEDGPDKQLCQMLYRLPSAAAGPNSNSSSSQQQQQIKKLPGGMCLLPQLLLPPADALCGQGTVPAPPAAAAPVSGLFQDLDSLTSPAEHINMNQLQQPAPPAQQAQQQLEAVQWGDWQQQQHDGSARALAVAGTAVLYQVWQLQQQAEQLRSRGDSAAAVRLCQAAIAAADGAGGGAAAAVCAVEVAATAAPTDDDEQLVNSTALHAIQHGGSSSSCNADGVTSRVVLGGQHILRIRVLGTLLNAAVDAAEWPVALEAARQLVPLYELVYPKVWPNLGLHYALLCKLELFLEHPAAAAKAAELALNILCVTHGSSADIIHDVRQLQYEAMAAAAAYRAD